MNLSCAKCATTFAVGGAQPGVNVVCPGCATLLTIPGVVSTPVTSPPQPQPEPKPQQKITPFSVQKPAKRNSRVDFQSAATKQNIKAQRNSLRHMMTACVALAILAVLGTGIGFIVDDSSQAAELNRDDVQVALVNGGIKLPTDPAKKTPPKTTGGIKLPTDTKKKPGTKADDKTDNGDKGSGRTGKGRILGGGGFTVPFMGIKAKGKRFCIIADRSGSMAAGRLYWDYKNGREISGGRESMAFLQEELISTLDKIAKGNGEVSILFYDTKLTTMPLEKPWARSKEDIEILKKWVTTIKPQGETFPLQAFQVALHYKPRPDVIFFMTDGIIPADTAQKIGRLWLQGEKVVIHTIQLDAPGMDPASVAMSRWAHSPSRPPSVEIAIEQAKKQHLRNLQSPAYWQEKQHQIDQMRIMAKQTFGEFRIIRNTGRAANAANGK